MTYDVKHDPGCWGCMDQGEDSHWEVIHCKCCREQWEESGGDDGS